MSFLKNISYNFRKSALARFIVLAMFFLCVFLAYLLFTHVVNQKPSIQEINPPVGLPGDALIITGKAFGDTKEGNYVEIGGYRLTSSSCLSWTNEKIIIVLPQGIADGLVYVVTKVGKSNPKVFANKNVLPILVRPDPKTALPQISNLQQPAASIGSLITITGNNFGSLRSNSRVLFTRRDDLNIKEGSTISCSESDFDYEYWSDQEIRIRVPDGASSGGIKIITEKGSSNAVNIQVINSPGTKSYTNSRTYIVNISVDITNIKAEQNGVIVLRIPRPQISASQQHIELSSSKPEPIINDLGNTIVHQFQLANFASTPLTIKHSFIVSTTAIETFIQPGLVKTYSDTSRLLYATHTRSDYIIHSDDRSIIQKSKDIVKSEKNPFIQARLVYDYLLQNCTLLADNRPGDAPPLDMLITGKGDAYDLAIVYTTLLRALNIPAIPVSGILVDKNMKSKNHWWVEFYIENFGWVPVDIALGAGLSYDFFQARNADVADYYFGNLDAQHITFSRGWNNIRPTTQTGKIVYQPKFYALQAIWEEGTGTITQYTSFWSNPYVAGIY